MSTLPTILIFIFTWSLIGYILSRWTRRNDIADVMWGLGFFVFATLMIDDWGDLGLKAKVFYGLFSIWSLRLTLYLGWRTRKHGEDARYVQMKKRFGAAEPWKAYLIVFLLQSILLALVALPVPIILQSAELTPLDFLGFTLMTFGLWIEARADQQMAAFKAQNKSGILNQGLWGLCRHPNYFGEILFWWSVFILAIPTWWTALSPLLLTFLIIKVSGVALLERSMKSRSTDYQSYIDSTPALIPIHFTHLKTLLKLMVSLLILDLIWLSGLMEEFYVEQSQHLARVIDGSFDALAWAAVGVYFVIPLGIALFALQSATSRADAFFRGSIYGFITYLIYELTNLALIAEWPLPMAVVDVLWGPILCGCAAWIAYSKKAGTPHAV